MSYRVISLLLIALMAVLSVINFIAAAIHAHRGDYPHATFNLVLGYGLMHQARQWMDDDS